MKTFEQIQSEQMIKKLKVIAIFFLNAWAFTSVCFIASIFFK